MNKLFYFLFIFLPICVNGQEYILQDSLKLKNIKKITYDLEGNLYILSGNSIYKYFTESAELNKYTSSSAIQNFSVPSKWKIYLFGDHHVQILNQQLAPLGDAIRTSWKPFIADTDNSIWQIDFNSRKLIKTDITTNQEIISFSISGEPVQMMISNNKIYVRTTDNEVLAYNNTGRLTEQFIDIEYPLVNIHNQVYFINNEELTSLPSGEIVTLPKPTRHFAISKTHMAIVNEETIFIYRIKK
ncbi:MAG: hypothetical protein ACNS60_16655 [Candidatus Cyclobacteriaceae bacterium M2_1C_046]